MEEAQAQGRLQAQAAASEQEDAASLWQINADLRRRLAEKDSELERLREQLAGLQRGSPHLPTATSPTTETPAAAAAPAAQDPTTTAVPTLPPQPQQQPSHIGEYHAIGSRSLPLLSAAHISRLNTSVTGVPSPSSVRQQQQLQQLQQGGGGGTNGGNPPEPVHQTDTASIRRRYMALERGEGAKPDLFVLGSIGPDAFLQSTVALDFDEDSPGFRRRLKAMDENVEGMRSHLQRLVGIVQRYIEAGQAFAGVGRAFASELMHLEAQSWFTRLGDLAPALVRFGETFDEIQNYQDAVLASLEATFLAPMREFVKRELKEVRELKDGVHRAHEEYLASLQRFLALKRGADPAVLAARTQELVAVRRKFELGRYDLVNTLNQLETKKKFTLVERVVCALYAYLGFFHQGHTELAALEPGMRELQHQLRLSRRAFAQQARIAEAKRMQLEVILSTKLTNIQGIKAQLALDDWSSLFDEAALAAAAAAAAANTTVPTTAASVVPHASADEAEAEALSPLGDGDGDRGDATLSLSRASTASSAPGSPAPPQKSQSLALISGAGTRSRHSSSASSILSCSLLPSTPPLGPQSSPAPPASPPPLGAAAMGGGGSSIGATGGRDGRSWSASFSSSIMMSPIDAAGPNNNPSSNRGRAANATALLAAHGEAGSGSGSSHSAICESGSKDALSPSRSGHGGGGGGLRSRPTSTGADTTAGATTTTSSSMTTNPTAASATTTTGPGRAPVASSGPCVKQGYLWKRSSNVRKDWKRRYFFIRNGKLSYQREDDPVGPPRADICDLMLSTVRECVRDADPLLTFEILSPGKRPYMLQAENEEEYCEWVHALRSQTEALLGLGLGLGLGSHPSTMGDHASVTAASGVTTMGGGDGGGGSSGGLGTSPPNSTHRHAGAGGGGGGGSHAAFVERVKRSNPYCADCGHPGPDWAVINAGICICIQCSGIHRSLGVHVSKVRSLTLDRWPRPLRQAMEGVGNERFNAIWEAAVPPGRCKPPGGNASREEREAWIRDKYVGRAFVAPGEPPGAVVGGWGHEEEEEVEDPDVILYHAARRGDVGALLWALAHGADVNWPNPRQRGRAAVHAVCEGAAAATATAAATAAGAGAGGGSCHANAKSRLICLELLHQNGACLDALDVDEQSPLDVAMSTPAVAVAVAVVAPGPKAEATTAAEWQLRQLNQVSVGSCSNMTLVSYLLSKLEK